MELVHSYAAGLVDGEGTVTLTKENARSKFGYPTISVTSTTFDLVNFLKKNYGGTIVTHKTYKSGHKQSWSWKVVSNGAIAMLEKIAPYMIENEKSRRAYLILKFYKILTPRNGKYTGTQAEEKFLFERNFFSNNKKLS